MSTENQNEKPPVEKPYLSTSPPEHWAQLAFLDAWVADQTMKDKPQLSHQENCELYFRAGCAFGSSASKLLARSGLEGLMLLKDETIKLTEEEEANMKKQIRIMASHIDAWISRLIPKNVPEEKAPEVSSIIQIEKPSIIIPG